MITQEKYRRHIKPRTVDYSNEQYGRIFPDNGEDIDPYSLLGPYAFEDRLQSRELARRAGKNCPIHSKDAWHESLAYELLSPENYHSGIWIPNWAAKGVRNANKARLLSWLLWWFDGESSRSRVADRGTERGLYETGPCRARVMDDLGERCLGTSCSRLSKEVNLSRNTVTSILRKFEQENLIVTKRCDSGIFSGRLLVRFNPFRLATKYKGATGDDFPDREFGKDGYFRRRWIAWEPPVAGEDSKFRPGWYESDTRKRAMNRDSIRGQQICRGTWVSDWIFVACEKKAASAQVLSQVLWWFSVKTDNNGTDLGTRARIQRHDYLWIAKSSRQLSQETGLPDRTVRRALDYLIEDKQFLLKGFWRYDNRRDRGQETLHLRPNVGPLNNLLTSKQIEEEAWEIESFRMQNAM